MPIRLAKGGVRCVEVSAPPEGRGWSVGGVVARSDFACVELAGDRGRVDSRAECVRGLTWRYQRVSLMFFPRSIFRET